jgi:hypothetical protein
VEVLVSISEDSDDRAHLLQVELIHRLIELALQSCAKVEAFTPQRAQEMKCVVAAIRILYNLGNFDRPKCYIPGTTVKQVKQGKSLMLWGGHLCLYFISKKATNPQVRDFCQQSQLHDFSWTDLAEMLILLSTYISQPHSDTASSSHLGLQEQDTLPGQVANAAPYFPEYAS